MLEKHLDRRLVNINSSTPAAGEPRPTAALRLHPQAALVPEMNAEEYRGFRSSVSEHGILVPIDATAEGVVLDGRARLRAARELGLELVPMRIVAPADAVGYMVLAAIQRRNLTPSQKAALAVRFAGYEELHAQGKARQLGNLRQNTEVAALPPRGKTCELVAGIAGVSARTAQDVISVYEHDQMLFEKVVAGSLGAEPAARRVRRERRDASLPPPPPLPEGPFDLLYGDPPWQMGSPDGRFAPENHYSTLPLEEIKAHKAPAAENAVLFVWAVNCLLPEALEVMEAWGFTYKAQLVWVKESPALGNWVRNQHELLLIGRKGSFPAPDPEDRVASVVEAKRRRHSEKPACVYELIERMYPHASKLELFARGRPRPGWAAWGNEVEDSESQEESR